LGGNEIAAQVAKTVSPNPVIPVNPVKREPSHPSDLDDWFVMESKPATPTATPLYLMTPSTKADSTGEEEDDYRSNPDPTPSKNKSSLIATVQRSNKSVVRAQAPEAPDLRSCLTTISGGAFEYKYLKSYEHGDELLECCLVALSEPAWRDPAHRMARAMEMMRDQYGFNVPGGWVQVMRALRNRGRQAPQAIRPQKDEALTRQELIREETAAWQEYEAWDDKHGTYDGFEATNPAAFQRFELRERMNRIDDRDSRYSALADELEKLEAEALADDDEPVPY
jgi:hypothetical protein